MSGCRWGFPPLLGSCGSYLADLPDPSFGRAAPVCCEVCGHTSSAAARFDAGVGVDVDKACS